MAGLAPKVPKPALVDAVGWPNSPPLAAALLLFCVAPKIDVEAALPPPNVKPEEVVAVEVGALPKMEPVAGAALPNMEPVAGASRKESERKGNRGF